MKQKYWFKRSFSHIKQNDLQQDNLTNIYNRNKNHNVLFYNEASKKQLTQIIQKARKINNLLSNLKTQNTLYHEINLDQSETKNQIRCLKHNNIIILYCFTDNKLLCSNCVYGTSEHTKHRVSEAKSMQSRMEQLLMIDEKTIKIRNSEITSSRIFFQGIQKKIENIKQEKLQKLEKEFQFYSALLSTHYQKSKTKIIQNFQITKQEVSCFIEQMKQLSKNMKLQHSLDAVRKLYVQQVMDELNKIQRLIPPRSLGQSLLQSLANYGKVVVSSFKYGFSSLSK